MQKINKEVLVKKAAELFEVGKINRAFGWQEGDFSYDVTPNLFYSAAELDNNFTYSPFCGANFSKYLIKETAKSDDKVLVFLKPCDTYSFNQLLTEHRFDREKVYAVGIPCDGMLDIEKIKKLADGVTSVTVDGDNVIAHTLFDGDVTISRADALAERCLNCKSKKHVAYDELIGEDGDVITSDRFDEVERIENMTPDERFEFWRSELSKCIRCNACRNVCPACTCESCVFNNPESGVENKAAVTSFEENMFHIIRAFHVAGRCTDCGECSRVCPQNIPLHLLNRKFIKDINELYGEYQAGEEAGQRSPLVDYTLDDAEPHEAIRSRGEENA